MPKLAPRLTPISPAMRLAKARETTRIHRVFGRTGDRTAVVTTSLGRVLPHPCGELGLIGGGQVPRPDEGSLADHGVRCLDELPECRRHGLAILRQPLDDEIVTIARASMFTLSLFYPTLPAYL
jgi:magnesium chelatase family protein